MAPFAPHRSSLISLITERVPRLVLAVDVRNEPALATYAAAGFINWDRRSVFLKVYVPRGE